MGKPQNAFLAKLQAKARAEEALVTDANIELDIMAMLLAANDRLQVGPGRADGLVNSFLDHKMEIAEAIYKELREDKSKKKEKEIVILKRDLAYRLRAILGPEAWAVRKTMFPFLRDFWDD